MIHLSPRHSSPISLFVYSVFGEGSLERECVFLWCWGVRVGAACFHPVWQSTTLGLRSSHMMLALHNAYITHLWMMEDGEPLPQGYGGSYLWGGIRLFYFLSDLLGRFSLFLQCTDWPHLEGNYLFHFPYSVFLVFLSLNLSLVTLSSRVEKWA